jgi:outer membrane protein assembly factor BamB
MVGFRFDREFPMRNIKQWMPAFAAAFVILGASRLQAQDWPQWRGANRDGKSAPLTVPANWPTNLTQKWKVKVGIGDSSPALVGGNLFVFARQDANEVLFCLNADTGNTVWQSTYPADYVVTGPPARHPGTRSSPAVANGKVCTLGVGGILSCFDAAKGALLWRKQSVNDYSGIPYKTDSSMSPLVADGRCIVAVGKATNGAVMAFDLGSGGLKWKWDGDGPTESSPVVLTAGGVKQLVLLTSKYLVGLALADGKLLWQVPFEAAQGNHTSPIIDGDTVIYSGAGKGVFAAKIARQGDGFAATLLWNTAAKFGGRFSTPVLKDGLLYGYSDHLFCLEAKTGTARWDGAANLGQTLAMVDAGTVMLALGGKGDLIAFKPGITYTELAHLPVATTETWAHPVVSGNRIFIKDNDSVALWTID